MVPKVPLLKEEWEYLSKETFLTGLKITNQSRLVKIKANIMACRTNEQLLLPVPSNPHLEFTMVMPGCVSFFLRSFNVRSQEDLE